MRWLLLGCGGEDVCAKHVKSLLIRERKEVNGGGVNFVVGDVDKPGAEETSPANSQHDVDVLWSQIMDIAVDILDLHSFSDLLSGKN